MPSRKKIVKQAEHLWPAQVWTPTRMQVTSYKPWERHASGMQEKATMLIREMIAGIYELHREHIEYHYGYRGWPADPTFWHPFEIERGQQVGMDELSPDSHGIPSRYGVTFNIARRDLVSGHQPADGLDLVVDEKWLEALFLQWASGFLLNGRWLEQNWLSAEIPKYLIEHKYSEDARDALAQAARLLVEIEIGSGSAEARTAMLIKEAKGRQAIQLTERRLNDMRGAMQLLVEQPFGIERDFKHLAQDFADSLNHALLVKADRKISAFHFAYIKEPNPICDTRGSMPGDSLARLNPLWTESDNTAGLIERWCAAYLHRLEDFVHSWTQSHKLPAQLQYLADYISGWHPHPNILRDFETLRLGPLEREAIERVKRWSHEEIKVLKRKLTVETKDTVTFSTLWGKREAELVRMVLKESGLSQPVAAKGKGRHVAAIHAACDHFEKHPKRFKDWPDMMEEFFPGSKWGREIKPLTLNEAPDWYTSAYHDMMLQLRRQLG